MTDSSTDAPVAETAPPKKAYRPRPNGRPFKAPKPQTPQPPRKKMVSSVHDRPDFENRAREIQGSGPDAVDYTIKARQLAVDNYNLHRDATKLPAWTIEMTRVLWFSKVGGNWSAVVGSIVAPGLQYTITYNGHRSEATIEVHKKINVVKISD